VHVFETTIRVLGDDPGLAPGYDGLLLRLAADLGDRLMAAFNTPSGLPGGHVHLQKVRRMWRCGRAVGTKMRDGASELFSGRM
jgi:hypothetical protein